MTINTEPIRLSQVQHATPIYDGLMADWGHVPGTLTEEQEEEMRAYAAQLAADPNPIVKGFEPAELVITPGEVEEKPEAPAPVVPVIRVGTLADKPQDPPVAEEPEEAPSAPQEAGETPEDPDAPELPSEAATQLLERVVPDTAVLPVVEEDNALVVTKGTPEPKEAS